MQMIDPAHAITPPPLGGLKTEFTGLLAAKRSRLNFDDECRFFQTQWLRTARAGMMSLVPLEEVQAEFMKAPKLGLSYDPSKMQAFCIAHFDDTEGYFRPRFYLGYKGMYHFIAQDKNITLTHTELVFENDEFVDKGPNAIPEHSRKLNANHRGNIIGGYSYSLIAKSNFVICTILGAETMQQIEMGCVNNGSQAWTGPFVNEMRKKTVTRRHFNDLLPVLDLSVELEDSNILEPTGFELEYATHGRE